MNPGPNGKNGQETRLSLLVTLPGTQTPLGLSHFCCKPRGVGLSKAQPLEP